MKKDEGFFRTGTDSNPGFLYSHNEQKGMFRGEYIVTHKPTLKKVRSVVWCSNFKALRGLCLIWSSMLPDLWSYSPSYKGVVASNLGTTR